MLDQITRYDVFISHKSEEAAQAVALQKALEGRGYSVFLDADGLTLARNVRDEIPEHLHASKAVVVLWSKLAGKSDWVVAEAIYAWGARKYVPVMLPDASAADIPRQLRDYTGKAITNVMANLQMLIDEIERLKQIAPFRIHNSMPTSGQGDILIGREAELAMLHQAWDGEQTNMVVLDAMGGTGKSALINRFLSDLANQGWGGAERVYAWSFYSQGTDDKRQGDADGFFDAALQWFGYRGDPVKGAERGRKLAALVREKRTLLVLDGLEPLQYPTGQHGLGGKLKDGGLEALIKALADQMHGLVIVTTRLRIPELNTRTEPAVIRRELHQLSVDAGVTLLKVLGVKAGDKQFRGVVELLRGHALSLNLLATFCNTVTNHLLPSEEEIKQLLLDPELGDQTYVMMRRYEILLEERANEIRRPGDDTAAGRQLALMYIIGLFDRPVEKAALDALFEQPIEGLTDALEDLSPKQWAFAVKALRDQKLLLPEAKAGEIDAHPLIREYFGRRLKETRSEAYRAANARLYEHYKLKDIPEAYHEPIRYSLVALAAATGPEVFQAVLNLMMGGQVSADTRSKLPPALRDVAPDRLRAALDGLNNKDFAAAVSAAQPATVKAMEPLFAAIAHGCAAGLHDAALREIFWARVSRGNDGYAVHQLGAFSAVLSALAHFFEQPFARPSRSLAEADQSLVLGQAAFALRALGRLAETVEPRLAAIERHVAAGDLRNAAVAAGILSETQLAIGEIGSAIAAGVEAVRLADAMAEYEPGADFQQLTRRTNHADALHQAGDLKGAASLFADAERRQAAMQEGLPLLYSLRGYLYCDVLLSLGEATEVRRRAEILFGWRGDQDALLDVALDTLSFGRSALALRDTAEAAIRLDAAVRALEDSGNTDDVPRGLLARAALHRTLGNWALAAGDLNATDEIADRSGLRLLQIDSAIERARLALARDGAAGVTAAAGLIAKAKDLIEKTRGRDHEGFERHYAKPTPDIALVEARIAILSGKPDAVRAHLAEAKRWIDRGWKVHVREHAELTALLGGKKPPAGSDGQRKKKWPWPFG